ncbi:MAG: agmatinase [Nannocystaceae bacterium]
MHDELTQHQRFLGALRPSELNGRRPYAVLVGLAWDGSTTYRAGARFGPEALRLASDSIETYCPRSEEDLEDGLYLDWGDLDAGADEMGEEARMRYWCEQLKAAPDLPLLALGGDHLAAYPFIIRALSEHDGLQIVHIDAHADLRDTWEGARFNHATVLRRVLEVMPEGTSLHQWGIRSGMRQEFELIRRHSQILPISNTREGGAELARRLGAMGKPVYVTLDVDGIDPADIPGTGTPEPAGLAFEWVETFFVELAKASVRLVGVDLVELAPRIDPTGRSSVAAARLVRSALLAMRGRTPSSDLR